MSAKTVIRKPCRKVCVGDLKDLVQIRGRAILPPEHGSAEFDEEFTDDPETWARVRTVTGKTIFDGVSQRDVAITHEVAIRFDETVTAEAWIELEDDTRLDIVTVEDLEERHEFMLLPCVTRGSKTQAASKA